MFLIRALSERDDETGEPLYWSNDIGWVDRESATQFTAEERDELRLPIGGRWVKRFTSGPEGGYRVVESGGMWAVVMGEEGECPTVALCGRQGDAQLIRKLLEDHQERVDSA